MPENDPPQDLADPYTELTRAQKARLVRLLTELGKTMAVASETLQYGYQQKIATAHYGHRADLERQLGRLFAAIRLLTRKGDVANEQIMQRMIVEFSLMNNGVPHQRDDDHLLDPHTPVRTDVAAELKAVSSPGRKSKK